MSATAETITPTSAVTSSTTAPPDDPTRPLYNIALELTQQMRLLVDKSPVPWSTWLAFVADRAERDWMGDAETAAGTVKRLAKGTGREAAVGRALDDAVEMIDRLRRFTLRWSTPDGLFEDQSTPVNPRTSSLARYTSLRFEARGHFRRLTRAATGIGAGVRKPKVSGAKLDILDRLSIAAVALTASEIEASTAAALDTVKAAMPQLIKRGLVRKHESGTGYLITDAGRLAILPDL